MHPTAKIMITVIVMIIDFLTFSYYFRKFSSIFLKIFYLFCFCLLSPLLRSCLLTLVSYRGQFSTRSHKVSDRMTLTLSHLFSQSPLAVYLHDVCPLSPLFLFSLSHPFSFPLTSVSILHFPFCFSPCLDHWYSHFLHHLQANSTRSRAKGNHTKELYIGMPFPPFFPFSFHSIKMENNVLVIRLPIMTHPIFSISLCSLIVNLPISPIN